MSNLDLFLFGIYPYMAITIFWVASWIRFDREQYTWKANSSQLLRGNIRVASNLFHIGILFIIGGHLVGLLTPHVVYEHFISSEAKQIVAMTAGGIAGVLMFIGLSMLIYRRMFDDRIRNTSSTGDIVILWLLMIQLLLGMSTIVVSTGHLDGVAMEHLAGWAQNTVVLRPLTAVAYIADVHIIYKMHIFFGLSLFVVFPFSRLVHILSAPVWYLGRRFQIVRQRQKY